jgi:hypothetical protein
VRTQTFMSCVDFLRQRREPTIAVAGVNFENHEGCSMKERRSGTCRMIDVPGLWENNDDLDEVSAKARRLCSQISSPFFLTPGGIVLVFRTSAPCL